MCLMLYKPGGPDCSVCEWILSLDNTSKSVFYEKFSMIILLTRARKTIFANLRDKCFCLKTGASVLMWQLRFIICEICSGVWVVKENLWKICGISFQTLRSRLFSSVYGAYPSYLAFSGNFYASRSILTLRTLRASIMGHTNPVCLFALPDFSCILE